MKIRQKKTLPRWLYFIPALLVVATIYYLFATRQAPSATQSPQDSQNKKDRGLEEQANPESSSPMEANSPAAGASADRDVITTPKPNLALKISGVKQSDDSVVVETLIEPRVTGKCTFEMTRLGYARLSTTSEIVGSNPDTSRCKNLSIPSTNLAKGEWVITVKINTDNGVATSTRTFVLQ